MSENFKLEIVSPDNIIIQVSTNEVSIPGYEGAITILKDHIPLVTFLRPGIINVKINEKHERFYVEDGTVEFSNNNLLILSSTIIDFKNLTKEKIDEKIKQAQNEIKNQEISDKSQYILSYKINTLKEINL
tara:strand:+ start:335 stop:727 length:393 start_codon:yes stop_codon:yes gene_type:complete